MQNNSFSSLWIQGTTRTGKTSRLVKEFSKWVRHQLIQKHSRNHPQDNLTSAVLVLAANNNNRRKLADTLASAVEGTYPVIGKTPVGFITDEVVLFLPLLFDRLKIKAQFPLRLRPETEQELATQLWRDEPDWDSLIAASGEYRFVRQTLDLLQLAGAGGIAAEDIPIILEQGMSDLAGESDLYYRRGELIINWRQWCLERGFLTYGIIYELYWRYLLLSPKYQQHLTSRHQTIFADDTDDYPAIARDLFELLLDRGTYGVFTYNTDGKVRLGLNADPDYLQGLAARCVVIKTERLGDWETWRLGDRGDRGDKGAEGAEGAGEAGGVTSHYPTTIDSIVNLVTETAYGIQIPSSIQSIQTISRAELLRAVADTIIKGVKEEEIKPEEIAIIAPGLDEIARYTLIEILSASEIAIAPVNEQRPLISSPIVRALLTLMALVYPGIGRLVDRDSIAEMLTIFSQKLSAGKPIPQIDPVRAGLLADYCYHVDPEQPDLLPVESFPRWDRLGHQATNAYLEIAKWISDTRIQQQKQCYLTPAILISKAIKHFLEKRDRLNYKTLSALRELIETAQHFWEVDRRMRQNEPSLQTQAVTVAQFIKLLRRGTISANPRPTHQFIFQENSIALATIFQYRSVRTSHRWQFWLDAGSHLWDKGGAATLFGATLFLKSWSGSTWMPEDEYEMDKQRLQRILRDLLNRVTEKVILCHSDLGVNGTEQMGPLLPLVQSSVQVIK